jgi:hypothetical protein
MNRRLHALASSLCGLGLLWGCAAEPAADADTAQWIAVVRSAHTAADAALGAGRPDTALERLDGALSAPVPPDVRAEHRRAVHQDLLFRVAETQLRIGQGRQAQAAAERGLALGRATDLFTANLLIARGQALQAEHRDTEAAASYYEALDINRALLDAALGQPEEDP